MAIWVTCSNNSELPALTTACNLRLVARYVSHGTIRLVPLLLEMGVGVSPDPRSSSHTEPAKWYGWAAKSWIGWWTVIGNWQLVTLCASVCLSLKRNIYFVWGLTFCWPVGRITSPYVYVVIQLSSLQELVLLYSQCDSRKTCAQQMYITCNRLSCCS